MGINYVYSCDVCGGGHGSYYGILPQFNRHFAGIRYKYRATHTRHPEAHMGDPISSSEIYHSAELWGRYSFSKRFQLFAFIPFLFNRQLAGENENRSSGLGDVTLSLQFNIFNTGDSLNHKWRHALQVGAGVKSPTGANNLVQNGKTLAQTMQLGTGSFDIPLNLSYTVRRKTLGINVDMNYKINLVNDKGYRIGNYLSSSFKLFYWGEIGQVSLLPQAGFNLEAGAEDFKNGLKQDYTGGELHSLFIGMDTYWKRVSFGLNCQVPVYQTFGGGMIDSSPKFSAQFFYLL